MNNLNIAQETTLILISLSSIWVAELMYFLLFNLKNQKRSLWKRY